MMQIDSQLLHAIAIKNLLRVAAVGQLMQLGVPKHISKLYNAVVDKNQNFILYIQNITN